MKSTKLEPKPFVPAVPAGEVYDDQGKLVGRYLFIQKDREDLLRKFCDCWLETYRHDSRFFLTIDLETTGLNYFDDDILLVSISWDGHHAIIFPYQDFIHYEPFIEVLNTIPINNQNWKFDLCFFIVKEGVDPTTYFDTMVAAQLAWAGAFPAHSYALDNLVEKLLPGFKISKAVRESFIGMKLGEAFSKDQIEYAVIDSLITHRLVYPIKKRLFNMDLMHIWEEMEKPLISIMAKAQIKGLYINVEETKKLLAQKESEQLEVWDRIQKLMAQLPADKLPKFPKGKFNPGAWQQVIPVMAARGIHLPNTKQDTLSSIHASTADELLGEIIKWRTIQTDISKVLNAWLKEHINPVTNCIHANFKTYGACTGRIQAGDPNVMAVAPEFRPLVIARPGHKILSLDYSAYEMRACAARSGEKYLIEGFEQRAKLLPGIKQLASKYNQKDPDNFCSDAKKGEKFTVTNEEMAQIDEFLLTDVHRRTSAMVLGIPIIEVTPKLRKFGKCVALDTYLHTDTGIVKIGELLPKKKTPDTVYPLKNVRVLTDQGFEEAPTIYYRGKTKAVRIATAYGRNITCSHEHKFRTVDKSGKYVWVQASKLKPNMPVFVKTHKPMFGNQKGKMPFGITTQDQLVYLGVLVGLYIKTGRTESDRTYFEGIPADVLKKVLNEIPDLSKLKVKIGLKAENASYVTDATLTQFFEKEVGTTKKIPKYFLENGKQWVLESLVFNTMDKNDNLGYYLTHSSAEFLRQVQNLMSRWGINAKIEWNPRYTFSGKPTIMIRSTEDQEVLVKRIQGFSTCSFTESNPNTWKAHTSLLIHSKLYNASLTSSSTYEELAKTILSEQELETTKFLIENNLRRDLVMSVTEVPEVEMCDVSVPSTSTVVYEGLVTHNTLNYAILYGAGPPRVQEALAKEEIFEPIEKCSVLVNTFFDKLSRVKSTLDEVHKKVLTHGYAETVLGRKRFFVLPPKWKGKLYEKAREDAFREASNMVFQSSNVDATKPAVIELFGKGGVFETHFPDPKDRPELLLTVHDEITMEVPDQSVDLAAELGEKIMIDCGLRSVGNKCIIECSKNVGTSWSH